MNEESLFAAALAKPSPAERLAFLDEACAGDAALRQRLERLLAADEHTGGILERGPDPGAPDAPPPERPGAAVGPYKLIEPIGEGGMGAVWLARQTEPVRRLVAVKLIKAGMDTRQVIARFEAERQALALMDHPNIARVLDGGTTPGEPGGASPGRPYFVMDLVRGVPITKYCDDNRLTPRQRLELFIPVCRAVQHAHQKGVIHRDLKPSNVLVAPYDGRPVPKVIDFGIAKAAGQSLTDKTLVTGFGNIVGTPEYMSPEQAEINQLDIDTRSDVYSLGVLLYELLTGSPPFTRRELGKGGVLEMLRVIREEEPTKPSAKLSTAEGLPTLAANRGTEPAKLTKLVRGELDWIVMKALEKDRSRRYETANGLAMDVQRYLADEPVLACPPSTAYRLRKFARRNKTRLAVAACMFLALTVMAASIGWAVRDRAARQADLERAEAVRRQKVADHAGDSLSAARILLAENKLAPAREKLAQARAQLGNDEAVLPGLAAQIARGQTELDRFVQFLDLIDRAHQAETTPVLEPTLAVRGSPGRAAAPPPGIGWERRPAAAVPFLLEALGRYGVLERDDWTRTLGGGLLGRQQAEQVRRLAYEELLWLAADLVHRRQEYRSGRKLSAQAAARAALVYLRKAEGARRPSLAVYVLRARCRTALGEEAAAQADWRRAVRTPATLAVDHFLRGQAANNARRLAEGVRAFEAALRLEPAHYWSLMNLGYCLCDRGRGPEDFAGAAWVFTGCILKRPDHAYAHYCRANAYARLGRYAEAVADYSRAAALDPKDARIWQNRGVIYLMTGQPDKAVADCSRAIGLNPQFAHAWHNRANAYYTLGRFDKALPDYSRAAALDPKDARVWTNRGFLYLRLGQTEKAVADCSRAVELDPKHVRAWYNRGVAYKKLRQPTKALADFSRAVDLDPKHAPAWNNRGTTHQQLGRYAQAVADFSRAIEANPKHAVAWYNRGNTYKNLGEHTKALADFSRTLELNPKFAHAWNNRGAVYDQHLGQPDKAVADYSRAIALNPKYVFAWNNRGLAYNKLGRPGKAVRDFSKAIALDPRYAPAWFNRGYSYYQLGQPDQAVADYSRGIALNGRYAPAWFNRGLAYDKLGRPDQAARDFSKAIALDPKDAGAPNALARLLATCPDAKVRDPHKAVQLAGIAVQRAPKVGDYWNTRGLAHYRAGNWKAAVAAFDKSMELQKGGDASDWLFRAMAHRKLGNQDEARRSYEQALQWLEKNQKSLANDKAQAEELRRFREEAEQVLGLTKK
jgi:tetratricopeptide (TPR) repeat protein